MHVTILTAFPEFFDSFLSTSIIGRAIKADLIRVDLLDLRSFGKGGYRQIDDYAFGTGGMVLMAEPLAEALTVAKSRTNAKYGSSFVVYPTPQGVPLTQETVETLSNQQHIVIICGHYEGLDERFVQKEVNLEVSLGDFVLTGGEIPAIAIIDAVSRLVPGVVGKSEAVAEDSFYRGMLDHPHYTRPACWEGLEVPPVLLSGDTAKITAWRRECAVERTLNRRPDLLCRAAITKYLGGSFYIAVHCSSEESLKPDDLEDLRLTCAHYGVERLFLVVPNREVRNHFREALHLDQTEGTKVKLVPSAEHLRRWIEDKEKINPLLTGITDVEFPDAVHWLDMKRFFLEKNSPVVLCFSEKNSEFFLKTCDAVVLPFRTEDQGATCLSLTNHAAVALDRFLGSK